MKSTFLYFDNTEVILLDWLRCVLTEGCFFCGCFFTENFSGRSILIYKKETNFFYVNLIEVFIQIVVNPFFYNLR